MPGRGVGHALLLGGDLALLGSVGLGEAGLGGSALEDVVSNLRSFYGNEQREDQVLTDSVLPSSA